MAHEDGRRPPLAKRSLVLLEEKMSIEALREYWRRWRPKGTTGFHYNSNEPSFDKDQGSNYNPRGWGR